MLSTESVQYKIDATKCSRVQHRWDGIHGNKIFVIVLVTCMSIYIIFEQNSDREAANLGEQSGSPHTILPTS